MTSRHLLILLVALLALTGCVQQAPFFAVTDVIGQVEISEGLPSVTRNARPYILDEQSRVYAGDILRTDNRSTLKVLLSSGHVITLNPQTQLLLAKVEQRGNEYRSSFSLSSGSIEVSSGNLNVSTLMIKSNIADVLGSRAHFWMGYDRGASTLTVVALETSSITVSNADGLVNLTLPGQTTTTSPGSAPGSVSTWSSERVSRTIQYYNQIQ